MIGLKMSQSPPGGRRLRSFPASFGCVSHRDVLSGCPVAAATATAATAAATAAATGHQKVILFRFFHAVK